MTQSLTAEQIHQILNERLAQARPVAWEEDISRNTLDNQPFERLAAPSQRDPEEFQDAQRRAIIEPLLRGRTIEEMVARDSYPIPVADDREGYLPGYDAQYWLSGLEDYLKILAAADQQGVEIRTSFDFGCASGRVVRHFAAQSDVAEIWGSDINRRHVRWLLETMPPQVKPIFNHCIPTLPLPDSSIDLITAFSVFTHIDTFETHWLAELRRILSPGGMAYLTVHNDDTWNNLAGQIDNPQNRLVQSMLAIDPSVREALQAPIPDSRLVYRFSQSGPYRAQVFHSNEYLRRVWGRFFTIAEILPLHHARQTVLVLRK